MDAIYRQMLPHLPPTLQDIILNPPNLSNPSSFIPFFKAILPYTQYLVVIVAFYIVWSVLSGLLGYFSRFMRFALKIGPIIGLIGWVMANSGQGGLGDLVEMVKQYAGLAPQGNAARAPGFAQLAGLFTGDTNAKAKTSKRSKPKSSSWAPFTEPDPVSSRTRNNRRTSSEPDILSSILESATGLGGEKADGIQGMVQDYVKGALAKAAGLDWLMGGEKKNDERKSTR